MIQKDILKQRVMEQIDFTREITDDEVREMIHLILADESRREYLSLADRERTAKELFDSIRKLDLLQELIEDPEITEIMINGTDSIFIEKKGRLYLWDRVFDNREKLEDIVQQIVSGCNRVINESTPIVDARLEDGSRVNVVLAPISINGPTITIRRFSDQIITMEKLVQMGSITQEAADFLKNAVKAGYNILISGGTGSGKTTFLNALAGFIPIEERVITIEDSAELQIRGIKNLVSLETRNANVEGCREITIRDLIHTALRMRPDRIIIGEVRGGEAIDMLQALNTGHDGSLTTAHANSAKDMISRLETMTLMGMDLPLQAIRAQIASGIDIIVQLGRLRDKSRRVTEISEIYGMRDGEVQTGTLYTFQETGKECNNTICGQLVYQQALRNTHKLEAAGIC